MNFYVHFPRAAAQPVSSCYMELTLRSSDLLNWYAACGYTV